MFKHCDMTVLNKMFFDRLVVKQRASSFACATKSGPDRMTRQKIQMGMPLRSKNFESAIETACQGPAILRLPDHPVFESDNDHRCVFHVVGMQERACFRVNSDRETPACKPV